jgi:hypothetical protein
MRTILIAAISMLLLVPAPSYGQKARGGVGIRASIGTDIELGLGFGGGVSYLWAPSYSGPCFEFGGDFFYHDSKVTEEELRGVFTEHDVEETRLLIFVLRANGVFNYSSRGSVFFIAGVGFVVASIEWKESETYTSSDPRLSQSPTNNEVEGTSVGNVINVGIGYVFKGGIELRLETPMLFFYSAPGSAASFVPTATFSIGYRL